MTKHGLVPLDGLVVLRFDAHFRQSTEIHQGHIVLFGGEAPELSPSWIGNRIAPYEGVEPGEEPWPVRRPIHSAVRLKLVERSPRLLADLPLPHGPTQSQPDQQRVEHEHAQAELKPARRCARFRRCGSKSL